MRKQQAIEFLGGTVAAASRAIGVTYQAVKKWPDPLPPRIADRVQAALWRRHYGQVTRADLRPRDWQQIWPEWQPQQQTTQPPKESV